MDLKTISENPPWEWPQDAGKTFGKLLKNRAANPADRLTAAELAGDLTVINDDLASLLMAVLLDGGEPAELRANAAIALGPVLQVAAEEWFEEFEDFHDPDSVPITKESFFEIQGALEKTYRDTTSPKLVQRRALEASVRAPKPWHVDAIAAAYASGDPEWMLTAVFGMQYVPGFESEVLAALQSPDPLIHYQAVLGAGEMELDAAWPHIFELAEDADTEKGLRLAAIEAIGYIRPEEAAELLLTLVDSEDEDIAAAAEEALTFAEDNEFDEDQEDEEDEEDEE